MNTEAYNYPHFDLPGESKALEDFPGFPLRPGERAPEGVLEQLDEEELNLSSLWKKGPAILEFGSLT